MPRDSRSELSVDIGAGASMHQKVMAELGVAHSTETRFVVAVAWHAEGRERLFPRFNGELEPAESGGGVPLGLNGVCTVPLGAIGGSAMLSSAGDWPSFVA
jgi:hypothetical protein